MARTTTSSNKSSTPRFHCPNRIGLAFRKCYNQRHIGPFLLRNEKQPVDLLAVDNDKLPVPAITGRRAPSVNNTNPRIASSIAVTHKPSFGPRLS